MKNVITSTTINLTQQRFTLNMRLLLQLLHLSMRISPKKIHGNANLSVRNNQSIESYTHLCEAQFDTPLFEGLGKLFQFL